jgi:hypothetical protein
MTARAFWLHYNKPASKQQGLNLLTIHYQGKCLLVHDIDCHVPLTIRHRKKQPRCVFHGKGVVTIVGNKAVITKGNHA